MSKEYVCPVCGTRVSDMREWDILGEVEMSCSECRDDADRIQELAEKHAIQGDLVNLVTSGKLGVEHEKQRVTK